MRHSLRYSVEKSVGGYWRVYDNHTGKTWWEAPAFANPALTGAVTEYLETRKDPAPEPTKSVAKRVAAQKKRLLHG